PLQLLAQIGTNWRKLAQIDAYWHRLAQIGAYWHRLAQIDADWHILAQIGTDWHKFPIFEGFCSSFVRDLFGNGSGLCFKNGILGDDSRRKLPEPLKNKRFSRDVPGRFLLFYSLFCPITGNRKEGCGVFCRFGEWAVRVLLKSSILEKK